MLIIYDFFVLLQIRWGATIRRPRRNSMVNFRWNSRNEDELPNYTWQRIEALIEHNKNSK